MNGELYQACALVAAVRQALRAGTFSYKGADYEKTIRFTFQNGARADSADRLSWFVAHMLGFLLPDLKQRGRSFA